MKSILLVAMLGVCNLLFSVTFTHYPDSLQGVRESSVDWGDYDNDGDLDLIIMGREYPNYSTQHTIIYNYDDLTNTFNPITTDILDLSDGSVEWGDYDNDGDLDILITGGEKTKIYKNEKIGDNYTFTDIYEGEVGLIGAHNSSATWGDYDNDGDLDILLTGEYEDGFGIIDSTIIYKNNNGLFTYHQIPLTQISKGSAIWGDYDNDGDLDIAFIGEDKNSNLIAGVHENNNGSFTPTTELKGLKESSIAWGDYDSDGELDLLTMGWWDWVDNGYSRYEYMTNLYCNDDGIFSIDTTEVLPNVKGGSCDWGDFDNDGDLDVLLTGIEGSSKSSYIYENNMSTLTDNELYSFQGVSVGSAACGDYNGDGDLDVVIVGMSDDEFIGIYQNDLIQSYPDSVNSIPTAPINLSSLIIGSDVTLSWNKSTDPETPQNGLSYNIYIGTASKNCDIKSPMSNINNGYRQIARIGNVNQNTSWTIRNLPDGLYYWSVQAIDNVFAGSEFSTEQSFFKTEPNIPQNILISYISGAVNITWDEVSGVSSYKIYACDEPYSIYVDMSSQGTFNNASWNQTIGVKKQFYYVVAVSE